MVSSIVWLYFVSNDFHAVYWSGVGLGAVGLSIVTATAAPDIVPSFVAFLTVHLSLLTTLLITGVVGYIDQSRRLIDLATVCALIQTLSFVAVTILDVLSGAIAPIIVGVVFLTIGMLLERGRRTVLNWL